MTRGPRNFNMERFSKLTRKDWIRIIIFAGLTALAVMNVKEIITILQRMLSILQPLIIGLSAAFILNIPMKLLEKKVDKQFREFNAPYLIRPFAIIISLLIITGILSFVLFLVVPQLISTLGILTEKLPLLYQNAWSYVEQFAQRIPALKQTLELSDPVNMETINKIIESAGGLANLLIKGAGGIFGSVINLLIGVIFGIYILLNKETLKKQGDRLLYAYLKPDRIKKIKYVLRVTNDTFTKFITGQVLEALVMGVITAVTMMFFRFPYATMIGAVIGVLSLIPMVGAISGAIIGFLIILTVNPMQAILYLLYIIILQQIDGNLIYPRIVGDSVGLPPLWVLVSITLGAGIYGITGVLLGVPVFATIYKLVGNDISLRLDSEPEVIPEYLEVPDQKVRKKRDMVRTTNGADDQSATETDGDGEV